MGQSQSSQKHADTDSKPFIIQAENIDMAKGQASTWVQMSLANKGCREFQIGVQKLDAEAFVQLLEWFSSDSWKDKINFSVDAATVSRLKIKVSKLGPRTAEGAVCGLAAGAAVGIVTCTIMLACGAVPFFGWMVGGCLIVGGLLAAGAAAGAAVGNVMDRKNPTHIKCTLVGNEQGKTYIKLTREQAAERY
eukprot:TRINITY_DN4890_c0_g1_i1.p1 TRINITY_DN4890_c0_g1~~TRINITY_DN4890_c0_g1_i1.p1  ORF type:complete len:192 (-),score=28.54 TRINITY_DN4890_c0_g1_i1:7-582(-)